MWYSNGIRNRNSRDVKFPENEWFDNSTKTKHCWYVEIYSICKMRSLQSLWVCFAVLCVLEGSLAIMFNLQPNTNKCLKDEMQPKELIMGEYDVAGIPGQRVDYIIKDSNGHILNQKEDVTRGKFSFSSENFETYEICFTSRVSPRKSHSVVVGRGIGKKIITF